jgi:death-on-curing protein
VRLLTLAEVLHLHRAVLAQSGGGPGLRSLAGLESAVAQPSMTFEGRELYPTLIDKAAALCLSLCSNHPFVDGNKRVAHAAMEVFLLLNGIEIQASVDEQEQLMLDLAAGGVEREALVAWLNSHTRPNTPAV